MKNYIKKSATFLLAGKIFLSTLSTKAFAFVNPVIGEKLGGGTEAYKQEASKGTTFLNYFVDIWQAITTVGALMVLIYFLWGSIEWISAGGDSSKIEKARNRITQSILGLIILIGSFVIIGFISSLFFGEEFSILNLKFIAPGESTTP